MPSFILTAQLVGKGGGSVHALYKVSVKSQNCMRYGWANALSDASVHTLTACPTENDRSTSYIHPNNTIFYKGIQRQCVHVQTRCITAPGSLVPGFLIVISKKLPGTPPSITLPLALAFRPKWNPSKFIVPVEPPLPLDAVKEPRHDVGAIGRFAWELAG